MRGETHMGHGQFGAGKATNFDTKMLALARGVKAAIYIRLLNT